jgi:hypothetical protein
MTCKSEQRDKLGVFILCGLSLSILAGVSWGATTTRIPSDSQTLLGVIVGGVMLFARECLQAIRALWEAERTGKLTDQLANSTTIAPTDPLPVAVVNDPNQPVPVKGNS